MEAGVPRIRSSSCRLCFVLVRLFVVWFGFGSLCPTFFVFRVISFILFLILFLVLLFIFNLILFIYFYGGSRVSLL